MEETSKKKHCGDCASFRFKPGRRRGTCDSRPEGKFSALYASGTICKRFIPK